MASGIGLGFAMALPAVAIIAGAALLTKCQAADYDAAFRACIATAPPKECREALGERPR